MLWLELELDDPCIFVVVVIIAFPAYARCVVAGRQVLDTFTAKLATRHLSLRPDSLKCCYVLTYPLKNDEVAVSTENRSKRKVFGFLSERHEAPCPHLSPAGIWSQIFPKKWFYLHVDFCDYYSTEDVCGGHRLISIDRLRDVGDSRIPTTSTLQSFQL